MVDANKGRNELPTLTLGSELPQAITASSELLIALEGLESLVSGQKAKLARGAKDYIEAVRHDSLWSVSTRRGGYFTLASFTAALTTDWSAREVRESRAAGSLWKRIRRSISSPAPEQALSAAQVRTPFAEFFVGTKFSIPQSGA